MGLFSNLVQRTYSYTNWKVAAINRKLIHQFQEDGNKITLWGYDGPEVHVCVILSTDTADLADFETNYRPNGNLKVDDSGSQTRQAVVSYLGNGDIDKVVTTIGNKKKTEQFVYASGELSSVTVTIEEV